MKTRSLKKSSGSNAGGFIPHLDFSEITPVAPRGLGGLIRDHFANGRLFSTVAHHGGLTSISYWGRQCLSGSHFFQAAVDTAWNKLFRFHVNVGDDRHYPTLNDTKLYPFGMASHCRLDGVALDYDLLLLPDALVQRVRVAKNPRKQPVSVGMLHQEAITAANRGNRTWSEMVFDPALNAFVFSCTDLNPTPPPKPASEDDSLAQLGLGVIVDSPKAVTWIGLGCDQKITTHRGFHHRSKHYVISKPLKGSEAAFFVVFAASRPNLVKRMRQLSKSVHRECDKLIADYDKRLAQRPRIDVGSPVLNSAFGQYPEMIDKMKIPDRPGATKATLAGYWVWGWDGMMPLTPMALANEPEYTAAILRFFQETRDDRLGLPMHFTTSFKPALKGPLPAQFQYVAGLYHYVATTGDLSLAREVFPTCKFIIDRCRKELVKDTGLVASWALWPDFPEAMGEDGHDVSSLNNSLVYQGLRAMEYLASKLGHAKLAAECGEWAGKLRASFVKYLYDEEKGYFISSCSSLDLTPRKHYCAQAIFWVTPFARELVSHAPWRIASFMDENLRSAKCLLTLPHWDTAWMADGNQLGSSYPTADFFYLNVHKLVGDSFALDAWLGDVDWFWRHHTAPEAFTPEADNEDECGPDNIGCKQSQAVSTWYSSLYNALAGLDFDHEGLTLTPWGDRPIDIRGLRLHGVTVDLKIRGSGNHIRSLKLNGKSLPAGSRKISWDALGKKHARIKLVRGGKAPAHPVVVRADGLRVDVVKSKGSQLAVRVRGGMSGEVVVQAHASAEVLVDGEPVTVAFDAATGTIAIAFPNRGEMKLKITESN